MEVSVDGGTAATDIDVFSHVRKSSYRLIVWGSTAKGTEQEAMGEDSLGFNLLLAQGSGDSSIRGGLDWMQCCTQGGGFQMDLRGDCDWSDPYVIRGGAARLSRAAFVHRRSPNGIGIHFYDEPLLTRHKHPVTEEVTRQGIPAQVRAFKAAFGGDPIAYNEVDPNNPAHVAQWAHWARWRLGFLEANCKLCRFAVERVRPDYLSATQSQFAWSWSGFADGYYFNVDRSLPVISGHGGYSHVWAGYFNPSLFLEMLRARNFGKSDWYLPTWFTMPSNQFRLEQYLSFITNIQGLATPPWMKIHQPSITQEADGMVESNKLMMRLGTIFTTMPVSRPPVGMLYSMSQNLYAQTRNMNENRGGGHLDSLMFVYLAGKVIHNPFMTVVEEDVLDGTLAAHHKAVVLAGIQYLDPPVIRALEDFAAGGGLVLLAGDCDVNIKGAAKLTARPEHMHKDLIRRLWAERRNEEVRKLGVVGYLLQSAEPLGREIQTHLEKAGIRPVFQCDTPGIVASRQAEGDIEYLFAVNACYDFGRGTWNAIKSPRQPSASRTTAARCTTPCTRALRLSSGKPALHVPRDSGLVPGRCACSLARPAPLAVSAYSRQPSSAITLRKTPRSG